MQESSTNLARLLGETTLGTIPSGGFHLLSRMSAPHYPTSAIADRNATIVDARAHDTSAVVDVGTSTTLDAM
eukprot:4420683-Karenia_brevis.AAC.1